MRRSLSNALLTSRAYHRARRLCRRPMGMTVGEYRLLLAVGSPGRVESLAELLMPWRWRSAQPLVTLTGGPPLDAA